MLRRQVLNIEDLRRRATSPAKKGDPPALAERFTLHDLRAKSASDDELEVATERLAHDDPRTSQKLYRRKPRRARPGANIGRERRYWIVRAVTPELTS